MKINNDLISRRSAIDSIKKCLEVAHDNWEFGEERAYVNAIECLEEEPPIQPQQKTGRWIEQTDTQNDVYYVCSNCKEAFTLIEGTPTDNLYNYCPNCGAKMGK